MKNKPEFIGHILTMPREVRKEYLSKKKKNATFVLIEIYANKQYGAVAKIYERNSMFDRMQETTTKAERKRVSESIAKIGNDNKRVDTSKWVKPDEKSIRYALVENLFVLEILKDDSFKWHECYGKVQAFYSMIHNHSPNNPQHIACNWSVDPYFKIVMQELKSPVVKKWWDNFHEEFKQENKTKKTQAHWGKQRDDYQIWKSKCLKNMIIPDPKPHAYKNIFKTSKKRVVKKNE